jgi:spermidine/putrescine transport system ATP-binding protein
MQGGRILQMGPPREIYEAPTHRFVADFIGDINQIEAEALPGNAVRLAGGAVLSVPHDARGKVTLAIRPERARLATADAGHLQAQLVHTAYLGTALLHKLTLANGDTFLLRQSDLDGSPPAMGSSVGIDLPADSLRVLVQ